MQLRTISNGSHMGARRIFCRVGQIRGLSLGLPSPSGAHKGSPNGRLGEKHPEADECIENNA